MSKVRTAAELGVNDLVRTPSGRSARVLGYVAERVLLQYVEADGFEHAGDEVSLRADLLVFVTKAVPQPLPRDYFSGSKR
jgi:hypothetical protein